jgi:hypothetical protein
LRTREGFFSSIAPPNDADIALDLALWVVRSGGVRRLACSAWSALTPGVAAGRLPLARGPALRVAARTYGRKARDDA